MTVLGDATQVANSAFLWIGALVGLITLVGVVITVSKFFKQQGASAERLENRLQSIEKQLKPNGLDTEQVGDVVKRTENAVNNLSSDVSELSEKLDQHGTKLDQHIGAEAEARQQIIDKIRRLERRDHP